MDNITLRAVKQSNIFAAKPYGNPLYKNEKAGFKSTLAAVNKAASENETAKLDTLSPDEYNKYFAHPSGQKDTYLPLTDHEDEIKIAWINTMDTLNDTEQYLAKIGIANAFSTGKNDMSSLLFPDGLIQNYITTEYTALTKNPLVYPSVDGKMNTLKLWQMMLKRFEENYLDQMSKKKNSVARMIKDARFYANLL